MTHRRIGEFVLMPGGYVGRVVAVFEDGAYAAQHLSCFRCDRVEKVPGMDRESLPLAEAAAYLVSFFDGTLGVTTEDAAGAATEQDYRAAKLPPSTRSAARAPRRRGRYHGRGQVGRPRQCPTCRGDGVLK